MHDTQCLLIRDDTGPLFAGITCVCIATDISFPSPALSQTLVCTTHMLHLLVCLGSHSLTVSDVVHDMPFPAPMLADL